MVGGPKHEQISRRKALRRLGAAGALVWTVPAIQTIGMSRAMAQTPPGSAPPPGCGNARVSLGGGCALPNFEASAGCGGQLLPQRRQPERPERVRLDRERDRRQRRRLGDLPSGGLPRPRALDGRGRQLLELGGRALVPGEQPPRDDVERLLRERELRDGPPAHVPEQRRPDRAGQHLPRRPRDLLRGLDNRSHRPDAGPQSIRPRIASTEVVASPVVSR